MEITTQHGAIAEKISVLQLIKMTIAKIATIVNKFVVVAKNETSTIRKEE